MIFGNPDAIAIEIGEVNSNAEQGREYAQFRFVLFGQQVGDWNDRIPLPVATGNLKTFLSCSEFRQDYALRNVDSETFFARTFTAFYEYDYGTQPMLRPNLRDRYHLSQVGGDSLCDRYAIVVADIASGTSRVVVRDLQQDAFILDKCFDSCELEEAGKQFIKWAERRGNKAR